MTEAKKNIYKKSLSVELIKRGNNFLHSMRNRNNPKYQVWVFEHTEQLERDIAELTGKEYVPSERADC